ncbi:DNA polymerase III subunit gamma/tau [Ignatzschineria sp. LJL83]
MTQQVLALKWRPRTFNEVIGQPHVVQALSNGLDNNRLHHAFLFTGTRGVGKTTLARIFAKSLNCETGITSTPCGECSICKEVDEGRFVDLIEIDAASRTRVEDTREILDNVQYAPTRGRYKIYLIDEVHMLSNSSFNALLKTLEEPPSHVKFLLATTDPQKLPVTVLSRCLRFQLKRIQDQEITLQLEKILQSEEIPYEESAVKLIAKAGDGSMRDALSLLDQAIAYTGQNIQFQLTHEMLGLIDSQYLVQILQALATKESAQLLSALNILKANGLDYYRFLEDLIDAFHLLTMMQLSPEICEAESSEMQALAQEFSPEDLQLFYQVALNGRKDLYNHPNSEVGFEMTLLRMILFAPAAPVGVAQAQKKSEQLEESVLIDSSSALNEVSHELSVGNAEATTVSGNNSESEVVNTQNMTSEFADSLAGDHHHNIKVDLPWEDHSSDLPENLDSIVVGSMNEHESQIEVEVERSGDADSGDDSLVQKNTLEFAVEEMNSSSESLFMEGEELSQFRDEVIEDHDDRCAELMPEICAESAALKDSIKTAELSALKTAESFLLRNNEDWLSLLSHLKLESVLLGIAHSLVFKSFQGDDLILERPLSVKAFRIDEAEMRLAMAISSTIGKSIACKIEYVEELQDENLHERTERLDEEKFQNTLASFKNDEVVQYLEREFDAVLLTKTLKSRD